MVQARQAMDINCRRGDVEKIVCLLQESPLAVTEQYRRWIRHCVGALNALGKGMNPPSLMERLILDRPRHKALRSTTSLKISLYFFERINHEYGSCLHWEGALASLKEMGAKQIRSDLGLRMGFEVSGS